MLKKFSFALVLASAVAPALAAAPAADAPVLFSADLALVGTATAPSATPYYTKECAKLPPPVVSPDAIGKAMAIYFPKTKTLKYTVAYNALSGPAMMAHFHSNVTTAKGPVGIAQTLCGIPPPDEHNNLGHSAPALNGKQCPATRHGFLSGEYVLKGNASLGLSAEDEEKQLLAGNSTNGLYLNFHTCLNMGGEIKGYLVKTGAAAAEGGGKK